MVGCSGRCGVTPVFMWVAVGDVGLPQCLWWVEVGDVGLPQCLWWVAVGNVGLPKCCPEPSSNAVTSSVYGGLQWAMQPSLHISHMQTLHWLPGRLSHCWPKGSAGCSQSHQLENLCNGNYDILRTLQWWLMSIKASFKSLATWLFGQQFVQPNRKKITKALLALWGKSTGDSRFSLQMVSNDICYLLAIQVHNLVCLILPVTCVFIYKKLSNQQGKLIQPCTVFTENIPGLCDCLN